MKRKVIQLANNTLVVSLPANWARKSSISKGDSVHVEEAGSLLTISPSDVTVSRRFVLDASKISFGKNILSFLYQKGYDEIEMVNLNKDDFNSARDRVSDLMGYEIVEHGEKRLVIKSVSKELESEFDNLLRRTFLITMEMFRGLQDALDSSDLSRLSEIRMLEKTTNTFTDFCKRVLSRGVYKSPENTIYMYLVVRDLEKVADGYKRICDVLLREKSCPKMPKKLTELFARTNRFFENFYSLFYKFDTDLFDRIRVEGRDLSRDVESFLASSKGWESQAAAHMVFIIATVYEMLGPLFILNFELVK